VQSPQSNVPGGGGLDYGATAQREATQLVLQNCGGARSGARGAVQEQAEEQFNNMSSEESGDGEILPATDPRGDAEIVFGHTAEAIAAAGCRAEDNRAAQQFIKQYNRHVTGDHMRFQNTLTKSVVGMARVYARALRSEEWSAARIAYSQFLLAANMDIDMGSTSSSAEDSSDDDGRGGAAAASGSKTGKGRRKVKVPLEVELGLGGLALLSPKSPVTKVPTQTAMLKQKVLLESASLVTDGTAAGFSELNKIAREKLAPVLDGFEVKSLVLIKLGGKNVGIELDEASFASKVGEWYRKLGTKVDVKCLMVVCPLLNKCTETPPASPQSAKKAGKHVEKMNKLTFKFSSHHKDFYRYTQGEYRCGSNDTSGGLVLDVKFSVGALVEVLKCRTTGKEFELPAATGLLQHVRHQYMEHMSTEWATKVGVAVVGGMPFLVGKGSSRYALAKNAVVWLSPVAAIDQAVHERDDDQARYVNIIMRPQDPSEDADPEEFTEELAGELTLAVVDTRYAPPLKIPGAAAKGNANAAANAAALATLELHIKNITSKPGGPFKKEFPHPFPLNLARFWAQQVRDQELPKPNDWKDQKDLQTFMADGNLPDFAKVSEHNQSVKQALAVWKTGRGGASGSGTTGNGGGAAVSMGSGLVAIAEAMNKSSAMKSGDGGGGGGTEFGDTFQCILNKHACNNTPMDGLACDLALSGDKKVARLWVAAIGKPEGTFLKLVQKFCCKDGGGGGGGSAAAASED
jgi:hypothetical protein